MPPKKNAPGRSSRGAGRVFPSMSPNTVRNSRAPRNRELHRQTPAAPPRTRAQVSGARVARPAAPRERTAVSAAAIFIARAEARAILWQCGEFDLHEAVDVLQAAAETGGLVDEIGQDAVQAIIAEAFGGPCDEEG